MYTFENIGKIKSLTYDNPPKEKHIKRIAYIKEGLLADFDYSEFKVSPPPKNESLQTYYELKTLKALPIDEDFAKEKDDIEKCFERVCVNNGIEYPKELVDNLIKSSAGIILDIKYHYKRPRPVQLSGEYGIKLTDQMYMDSMKTPSYPSGHSCQGILISKVLATKYPHAGQELMKEGKDISYSRNIARAHYPSDSKQGEKLGDKMYQYLKNKL